MSNEVGSSIYFCLFPNEGTRIHEKSFIIPPINTFLETRQLTGDIGPHDRRYAAAEACILQRPCNDQEEARPQ